MNRLPRFLFSALAVTTLAGCAQQVGDIDRTQPMLMNKTDFDGTEWYVRQTINEVPATTSLTFVGLQSATERIRFKISEAGLHGYRSYELNPGASSRTEFDGDRNVNTGTAESNPLGGDLHTDQVVIGFPVTGHYDVQRQYNAQTGEESNVIVENSTDRYWSDREFFRANWQRPEVLSLEFFELGGLSIVVDDTEEEDPLIHREYDDEGNLIYFDVTHRHLVEPWIGDCILWFNAVQLGDCAAQRIEIRTSFMRAPSLHETEYEPVAYDDKAMNRFGYFRTERLSYDRQRGATYDGRLLFANRHNIWTDTWQRNADGSLVLDDTGKRVARPFSERTPRPIVYHLSPNFPEPLRQYAVDVAEGWDRSFRRAVAAAQNAGDVTGWESVRPMFMLCDNPVTAVPVYPEDPAFSADCGAEGTLVRVGDIRYHVMWWVDDPQLQGPLGYGPSGADPMTGEILSGTAYVYGAAIDTYAQFALDTIRFVNGDLTPEDLEDAEYIREQIRPHRHGSIDPRAAALTGNVAVGSIELPTDPTEFMRGTALNRVEQIRSDVRGGRFDLLRLSGMSETQRMRMIQESGLDMLGMNDEFLLAAGLDPQAQHTDEELEAARAVSLFAERQPQRGFELLRAHRNHDCILAPQNIDDSLIGISEAYRDRRDYENVYQELRGLIFKAVMEHEVGHTIGLRHNFAASWDSLNYFDEFWDAKIEGYPSVDENGDPVVRPFGRATTIADTYGMASLLPSQSEARMREFQYSSIMDYSSGFHTDFGGIGRYDDAAIVFGYTTGVDQTATATGRSFNKQEMGYVEAWDSLPVEAREIFQSQETQRGVGYYHLLERYHYATLVSAMGDSPESMLSALRSRRLVKLDEMESMVERRDPNRPVEVPYMFCSDELRGSRQSCNVWDRGADPLEQTLDTITRYRYYYYFDNYRRERLSWDTSTAPFRAFERYFTPLVNGYQQWLLAVAFTGNRPDPALDNAWTFAAYAGLNLLAEAVTTPSSGYYQYDTDSDTYKLITARSDLSLFDRETEAQIRRDADFSIPEGQGRPKWSDYDNDLGYYYYRFPRRSGHFLTSLLGLQAFTQAQVVNVVGVDTIGFDQSFVIPPYLVFSDELTALFNGIILQDPGLVGPIVTPSRTGFTVAPRPLLTLGLNNGTEINPETGAIVPPGSSIVDGRLDEALGVPLDPRHTFTDQVWAALFGMSGFTSNYSVRYVDQGRIWELSAGATPVLNEGFATEQFCDPTPTGGGKCYASLAPSDDGPPGLSVEFIRRGALLVERYEEALEGGDTADANSILNELNGHLQDINIMISVSELFQRVL